MPDKTEILRVENYGLDLEWVMLPDGTVRRPINLYDWFFWTWWGRHGGIYQIGETFIGNVRVSTVFLGMDHAMGMDWGWEPGRYGRRPVFPPGYQPVVFETMVFGLGREVRKRYATLEAARKGHEKYVRYTRKCVATGQAIPSYRCPRCGKVSYNPNDLLHRYCGRCHRFESDPSASPD